MNRVIYCLILVTLFVCVCVCVCQGRVVELGGVYVLSGVMSCRVNSLFECLCVCVCVKDVS